MRLFIKKEHLKKVVIAAIFLVLSVYFYPQYQQQVPKTREEIAKIAQVQVAGVPAQTPLVLATQPNDGLKFLHSAIQTASKTIDVVIYQLQDSTIEQDLVDAKTRGVRVRVILQNISSFGRRPNQEAYDFLKNRGVAIKWAPTYFALTHQKTFIVDDSHAIIMTLNLNPKYYASGRDFALIDGDPQDVAAIEGAFESDWNGWQIAPGNGSDLVWSPGSADTLLALINSSTKSLDIYNEEMADPRITEALESAAQRGVDVRVTMTYATNWKAAFNELSLTGVNIRTYPSTAKIYIHAKVIIADKKTAFVGSENFSVPSLDLNRELGILISRPDIIDSLQRTFNADWLGARPFKASEYKAKSL